MAGGINLATKYSKEVDERWVEGSQAALVSSNRFNFKGVETVVVYSIPISPLNVYSRNGTNRYGTPDDLGRNVQTMKVTRDMGFSFVIDRGDEIQSEYTANPGSALDREIREVITPDYDTYCFHVMAQTAINHGNNATTAITKNNAHEMLLNGIQRMADQNVPIDELYCFSTYSFINLMMQDSSFIRYGDDAQKMLIHRDLGMAEGAHLISVPPARLPAGTAFLLVHKDAIVAPRQLEEYKTHVDPPGISGTLCEGRVLYDCFVLDEKVGGIYFHGGQSILKPLNFMTKAGSNGMCIILMNCEKEKSGNIWYAKTATDQSSLPAVSITSTIDPSSGAWANAFEVKSKTFEFEPTAGHTRIRIVEVGSNSKPIACWDANINVAQ